MSEFRINRAPVLTLWGTVVAERLGHDRNAAVTMGQALAGHAAQAKGRRLGIYEESKEPKAPKTLSASRTVVLLGCPIPLAATAEGERAIAQDAVVKPEAVIKYLRSKFGENLGEAFAAMEQLAKSYEPERLNAEGFRLYEKFRPEVPRDEAGWGKAGVLDLGKIRGLACST